MNTLDFANNEKFSDEFFSALFEILKETLDYDPLKRKTAQEILGMQFFESKDKSFFSLPKKMHSLEKAKLYLKTNYGKFQDQGNCLFNFVIFDSFLIKINVFRNSQPREGSDGQWIDLMLSKTWKICS